MPCQNLWKLHPLWPILTLFYSLSVVLATAPQHIPCWRHKMIHGTKYLGSYVMLTQTTSPWSSMSSPLTANGSPLFLRGIIPSLTWWRRGLNTIPFVYKLYASPFDLWPLSRITIWPELSNLNPIGFSYMELILTRKQRCLILLARAHLF